MPWRARAHLIGVRASAAGLLNCTCVCGPVERQYFDAPGQRILRLPAIVFYFSLLVSLLPGTTALLLRRHVPLCMRPPRSSVRRALWTHSVCVCVCGVGNVSCLKYPFCLDSFIVPFIEVTTWGRNSIFNGGNIYVLGRAEAGSCGKRAFSGGVEVGEQRRTMVFDTVMSAIEKSSDPTVRRKYVSLPIESACSCSPLCTTGVLHLLARITLALCAPTTSQMPAVRP